MDKFAFIFIGRSGCGKGTQAALLIDHLKTRGVVSEDHPILYIQTGDKFREFIGGTSYSSRLSKAIMDRGGLQPAFLAVWNWSHTMVENITGDEHAVFDGMPRMVDEAKILDTAVKYYSWKPYVINLDVSREWAKTRLLERQRADDNTDDIEARLNWYEQDVAPAVEYYAANPDYRFLKINGEQPIDGVHSDIVKELEL